MTLDEVMIQAQLDYEQGEYERSYRRLEAFLAANPPHHRLWRGMGVASMRRGNPQDALHCLQEALKLKPNDPEVRFSLALYHFSQGEYREGFLHYEARMEFGRSVATFYTRRAPFWDGRPLTEKTLLIHCEQGMGDSIQFIRFLPQLLERVKTVYVACHRELFRLFSNLPGVRVITEDHETPAFDFQLPLLSLGRILGLTPQTIPARVPYLPIPALPTAAHARPRIGLVWRAKGAYRTMPLDALRPLARLPVDWVSLQKEIEEPETAILREDFHADEAGSRLNDFQDTADIMQNLDLVVTVDTAAAHLAGALARKTWVLLPKWSDWRWLPQGETSPWYPTVTLFPQREEKDWREQVSAVAERIKTL